MANKDELTALLGGGLGEHLARPAVPMTAGTKRSSSKKDVADMTVQETAEYLRQQQQQTKSGGGPVTQRRHRAATTKVRAYHELLHQEQQEQQQQQHVEAEESSSSSESEQDEPLARRPAPRKRAAPVVVVQQSLSRVEPVRRRRADSSESSSDDDEALSRHRHRHRRPSSSSSDSDDSHVEQRRQRLLRKKQQQQPKEQPEEQDEERPEQESEPTSSVQPRMEPESEPAGIQSLHRPPLQPQKQADASSSEESSSSSSSEESSSSDDDDDEAEPLAKPLFVPRHKRGTVPKVDEVEEMEKEEKLNEQAEQRQRDSRRMVQQVLEADAQQAPDHATALEGITGAMNAMPDDADDDNANFDDAWQVRELARLLADWDVEQARMAEERELQRRRQLTDEERFQEDVKSGRYRAPGQGSKKMGGRYYHKGGFFNDADEWDANDVRFKADEYAQAATGEDKIDRRQLPKVMQTKRFGRANQNLRYQGLKAEDTTDPSLVILPLVQGKKSKGRR